MRLILSLAFAVLVSLTTKADPDSWPWGAEMPFPWKGIQGTWAFYLDNNLTYIGFKTIRNNKGSNQLEMILYQGKSCKMIADGKGFEDGRVVTGMIVTTKGDIHVLTIHVFSDETMRLIHGDDWKPALQRSKTYTVMNVTDFSTDKTETFELRKVNYSPYGICSPLRQQH